MRTARGICSKSCVDAPEDAPSRLQVEKSWYACLGKGRQNNTFPPSGGEVNARGVILRTGRFFLSRAVSPFSPSPFRRTQASTASHSFVPSSSANDAFPPCMSSTAHQDKRHSQRFYSPPSDSSPPPIPLPPTPSSATPLFSSEGTKPTPQRSSYSTGRPRAPPITRSNTAPPLPSNGMAHSPLSPLPRYSPDGNELQSNGHYAKVRASPSPIPLPSRR